MQLYSGTKNIGKESHGPQTNEVVAAKFMKHWYRAKVDSINLDGTLLVKLIDYGNQAETPATRIRRLLPYMLELGAQVSWWTCIITENQQFKIHVQELFMFIVITETVIAYPVNKYHNNTHKSDMGAILSKCSDYFTMITIAIMITPLNYKLQLNCNKNMFKTNSNLIT